VPKEPFSDLLDCRRQLAIAAVSRTGYVRCWHHYGMSFGRESVMGANSFYTVMVREERGWRQLVAPALRPEGACSALADLIREQKPLDQQSDEDRQHVEQALQLLEQDDCEMIIEGRRHRLVKASLTVSFEDGRPCGPAPDDLMFMEGPWHMAEQS